MTQKMSAQRLIFGVLLSLCACTVEPFGEDPVCDTFEAWTCTVTDYECKATCGEQAIVCNGEDCAHATGVSSSETCDNLPAQTIVDCRACEDAFKAGCD